MIVVAPLIPFPIQTTLSPSALPRFSHYPKSLTSLSKFRDRECNLGNLNFSGSSHTHLSSQNHICSSFPSFQKILRSNHLGSFPTSQILHKSFHQVELFLSTMVTLISLQDPYLESNIPLHTPSSSYTIFHFHLANRAKLNLPTSLMLRPPTSVGEHTLSQAT